ncbi:ATP-dependent RNA helicase DbpA [Halopseudomonas salegens]|uniref:ATP-dependent RNA helicase DbpA n=1 Tax=Halopseudomonas salegens TaxID=1434072 RepID=A0A1H2I3H8_9GAMM|nr:ATP-dependent RNA helicase DbpA [Halopseudomonas salegens]SDU38681.1 ATP-dependent RNA helicase DbpA [Halopseudomonas salegens]
MSDLDFSQLDLNPELLDNLQRLGYAQMTPIQQQSLPRVLAGKDLIAQADTGSGKTAAFALGVLQRLNPRFFGCQALILCPTRELATQVAESIRQLAKPLANVKVLTLCGGTPIGPQIGSLEHGAHIVVGTPGRIEDHLRKQTLQLDQLRTLVLDEADRMLDMGFYPSIVNIAQQTPDQRQTLLFSATFPDAIAELSAAFQRAPERIQVSSGNAQDQITQTFYRVAQASDKADVLLRVLAEHPAEAGMIFCQTKQGCAELANFMRQHRFAAVALHGDLDQKDRDQVWVRFSNASARWLIATDVAARGLDLPDLPLVINFDVPRDADTYVHRIGRTGRAGQSGRAVSLFTPKETQRVEEIGHFTEQTPDMRTLEQLAPTAAKPQAASMVTLELDAGRKSKLRPGDILGALTKDAGLPGTAVGKINLFDTCAYVAIQREHASAALKGLQGCKVKGRSVRARQV